MSELHIRNVPQQLHEQLRHHAAAEGRSVSADAIVLLRRALNGQERRPEQHRAALARLDEIRGRNPLPSGAPTAEQLVREDRDAAV